MASVCGTCLYASSHHDFLLGGGGGDAGVGRDHCVTGY